jgi:7-carboxy-7-deazaguanine synthase
MNVNMNVNESANFPLETEAKFTLRPDKKHPVMEIFGPTIQGEGMMLGMRTMFIRFGGCDYRCEKCDSLHAVLPELVKQGARYMNGDDIAEALVDFQDRERCDLVTFSGGNPCIHDLDSLVHHLKAINKYRIAVETQGTIWQDWLLDVDYVTISPKGPGMGEKFEKDKLDIFLDKLDLGPNYCLKVVIMDQRDIEFAADLANYYPFVTNNEKFYLSLGNPFPPRPDKRSNTLPIDELLSSYKILTEDILKEPRLSQCIITPQLHVLLWGNKKGV